MSPSRLRFDRLDHDIAPDGRCLMTVHLSAGDTETETSVDGLETHQGRLRATAQATLAAAAQTAPAGMRLHLVGVKSVRAFDGWVVIARVNAEDDDGAHRLLGAASAEVEEDVLRATAQATLDATNRLLERHLAD